MGRRKKKRYVREMPEAVFFKPRGVPMRELKRQTISIEGFEAIRLVDGEGLMQQEAADRMGVSRPTLSRILAEARNGIATALTNGWAIELEGGAFHLENTDCEPKTDSENQGEEMRNMNQAGPGRGRGQGQGRGRGQGKGRGMGSGRCRQAQGGQQARRRQRDSSAQSFSPDESGRIRKLAITSEGPTLKDRVDPRFGRAAGFVVVDIDTMETKYIDNGSSQAMNQGAGIQAAENAANAKADAVLTGYVGPKAFTALTAAGILVGQDLEGMTVGEAVEHFKSGDIVLADAPNAQSGANK